MPSSSSSTPSPSDDEDGGAEDKDKKRQRTEDEDDDGGASDDEKERSSDIDIDDDPELDDEDDDDGAELDEDDEEDEEEEGEESEELDDEEEDEEEGDDDEDETEEDDGLDDGLDDDDDEEDEETESVRSDSNDDEDDEDEDDDDDIAYETLKADFKKREREAAVKRKKEGTRAAQGSSSAAEQQEEEEETEEEGNGWTCDVCRTATFKTFDEACEHEATCDGGQQGQGQADADDDKTKKKEEIESSPTKKTNETKGAAAAASKNKAAAAAASSSSSSSDAMSDSTEAFEESQQQQKKKRTKDDAASSSSDANDSSSSADVDNSSTASDEYDLDDDDVQLVTYLANSNATTVSDVEWSSSGLTSDRWHEFMKFHIPMDKFDLPVFELARYVLDKTKKNKRDKKRDKKERGKERGKKKKQAMEREDEEDEDEEMEDEAGRSTKKKEAPATEKENMDKDKGKEDKERAIIESNNDRDTKNNHKDGDDTKDDRQEGRKELAVWACDKCSRRFILYDIAVRHEETCTGDADADATAPNEEEGGEGGTQRESEERTAATVVADAAAIAETEKEGMIVEETTTAAPLAPSGKDPVAAEEEGLTQQELEERTAAAIAADAAAAVQNGAAEVETKARQRSEEAAEAALAQAQAVDDGDKKKDDVADAKAAEKEKGGDGPVVMMWTCDVCKAAHFPTYEEACAHEATCSGVAAVAEGGKVVGAAAAAAAATEKAEEEAKEASNKKSSSDGGAHEVIEVPSSSDSDDSDDDDDNGANKDASSSSSPRRSPKRKRTDSTASSTVAPPTSNDDDVVEHQERIDVTISRIAPNAGFGVKVRSSLSAGKGSALIDVSPSHVPAELKEGDEIVSVNGQSVTGMKFTEVVSSMKRTAPGDDLRLSVIRRRTTNTTAASSKRVRIDSSSSAAAAPAPDNRTDQQEEEEEEVIDVFTTFLPRLDSGGFGITLRTSPPWLVRKAPSTSSIRKGDEVIEVNTIQTSRIVHLETFKEIVQKTPPGVELQLKVSRRRSPGSNGSERSTTTATERSERTTTASLEEQPQPEEEARAATNLVATATDGYYNYYSVSLVEPGSLGLFFKASEDVGMNYFDRGAIITRIIPDSPADRAGIQPGDVVCATVGTGREAYAYSDFLAACSSAARPVNFNVRRPMRNAAAPMATATVEESPSDPQQLQRPSWEEAATAIPHSSPPLPLVCDVCGGGEDNGTKGIMCHFGAASDNSSFPAAITVHFSCGINPPDNKREYAIVSEENILHKHHEKTLCQGLSMGFDEAELQGIVKDVLSKMKCLSEIDIGAKPVRFYLASEVQGVLKEGLLAAYLRRRSEGAASAPSSVNEEAEKGTAIAAPTESAAAAAETSQNLESMDVNLFEAQENAAQLDDGQRSIEENQTSSCPETASADETEPPYERQHSSVGEELLAGEKPTLPPTSSRDDVTTQATLADSDGIVAAPAARPTVNVCSICGQAQGDSPLCIFPSTHTDSGDGTLWCVHASCGLRASFPNVNRPEYEILSAASIEASYFFLFPDRQATLRNLLLQTRSAVVSVNGKEEHFYLASDFRRRISSAMPASNVAEDVATDRGAVKDSAPLGAALGRLGSADLAAEIDEQPYIDIDTDGQHDKAKEGNGAAMVMAGTTENHQGSVEGNSNIEARVKSRPLTLPGLPVWQKHGKVCRSEEKFVAPLTDEEDEPLDISDDSDVEEDSDASDDESRTYGSPKPIIDVAIARQPGGGFGITIQSNSRDNAYVVSAKKQPLVKSGDKILFVNGKNTAGASFERIVEWVRGTPQGESLRLKLERRNPKLSPRKGLPAKHQPPLTETSFSVSLTEPGRLGFLIEKRPEDGGAIVARVVPDSQASRVGLLAGDIICDPRRAGRAGYNYEDFVKECSGSKRPVVFIVKRPIVTSGAKGRVDGHQQRPTGGITVPTQSQVSSLMARSNMPLFAPAHHAAHSFPPVICTVCGRGNMGTPMCTFPGKNMGAVSFAAFSIHVACGLSASLPSINKANFEIMPESAVRTTFGGSPLNLILPQVRSAVSCFAGQYTTYYLMSDLIAHLSRKNYYSSALASQNTGNGPVPSTTTPKSGANGLYLRPAGRGRKGMNWDPARGVWVPLTQGATHDSVIVGMPASKFSEDQISKMPVTFAYKVNDGGESEQQAIIATAQWSQGVHAAQREKKRKASTPSKEGSAAKRGGSGRKPFGSGSKEISSGPSDDFPGFTVKVFERMGGHTKGRPDLYWFSPKTSKKLRSKVEVKRFIAALEETAGDEDQAWNIIKKR